MKKYFVLMTLIAFFNAKIVVASDKKPVERRKSVYAADQKVLKKKHQ